MKQFNKDVHSKGRDKPRFGARGSKFGSKSSGGRSGGFGNKSLGASSEGFGGKDRFGSNRGVSRSERPQMHDVTCSACRKPCQVPFRPTNNKPVYCKDCFGKQDGKVRQESMRDNAREPVNTDATDAMAEQIEELTEQVEALNDKLDRIMKTLNID